MKMISYKLIVILLYILSGCTVVGNKNSSSHTKSENWTSEYGINKETLIQKVNTEKAMKEMADGKVILFLSSSDCPYCQIAFPLINELANKYQDINVLYIEVGDINQKKRKELNEILGNTFFINENNEIKISVPDVYAIKNNEVLGYQHNIINNTTELNNIYNSLFQLLSSNE